MLQSIDQLHNVADGIFHLILKIIEVDSFNYLPFWDNKLNAGLDENISFKLSIVDLLIIKI